MTHSVADAALITQIMAGPDDFDATVSDRPVPAYYEGLKEKPQSYKIGYIAETLESAGLHAEVKEATWKRIEALKAQGHTVEPVSFNMLDYVLPTYYILTAAEASTNLARFDGVRYGFRAPAADLEGMYKNSRSQGFGPEVQRRILLGTFVLSASYYDAYFTKAQRVRRLVQSQTQALLGKYDFLISPTAPSVAVPLGKFAESDVLEMYLADLFTVQASVAGIPAISVPNGTNSAGLPIGFQVMAGPFEEQKLLQFAHTLS
jgi:aspartyl-tRNA(Asn)/glutamyl-tRNA(Gln) amidotransferase subunit A